MLYDSIIMSDKIRDRVQIGFRPDPELLAKIDAMALTDLGIRLSRNQVVTYIIETYFSNMEEKNGVN